MIQEEHEVTVLGAPQGPGPVMSTVVNIRSDTAVPDHIVWSLFNTLFMNPCCLGFVAFAYSVKVGGCVGAPPESACQPADLPRPRWPLGRGPRACVRARVCPGQDEAAGVHGHGQGHPSSPGLQGIPSDSPRGSQAPSESAKGLRDPWTLVE